jgi:hypothetical protein
MFPFAANDWTAGQLEAHDLKLNPTLLTWLD